MDADELIDDYLAKHVDRVNNEKEDWEYHIDPWTGKKLRSWDELYELWDIFGRHHDPSTDTKSLLEPMSIP